MRATYPCLRCGSTSNTGRICHTRRGGVRVCSRCWERFWGVEWLHHEAAIQQPTRRLRLWGTSRHTFRALAERFVRGGPHA